MSKHFPQWMTADIILSKMIAPKIGAYVYVRDGSNYIELTFLPQDVFLLVPPEDQSQFQECYMDFAKWVMTELNLEELCERYIGCVLDPSVKFEIEHEISTKMEQYNAEHTLTIGQKFLEIMGVIA